MLELGDAELDLVQLLPRYQPELPEEAGEALARALAQPARVPAPAGDRVLEHLAGLVAADAPPLAQVAGELVQPLGGQRDRADCGQRQPLERVSGAHFGLTTRWLGAMGEYEA